MTPEQTAAGPLKGTNALLPLGNGRDIKRCGLKERFSLLPGPFHRAEHQKNDAAGYLAWALK